MRIGLIVNPLAGLGGRLAFKGSDEGLAPRALALGTAPLADARTALALKGLRASPARIVTCAGSMGETAARAADLPAEIVYWPPAPTRPADTIAAARRMIDRGIDLLVFAGGDGTARDLLSAGLSGVPVLGIPAGVKMHSAVFAESPAAAAMILAGLGRSRLRCLIDREVIDRDPETGLPRLYGVLPSPATQRIQSAKAFGAHGDDDDVTAAARMIADDVRAEALTFIGPGETMMRVKTALGGGTLAGIDAYAHGALVHRDADEAALLALAANVGPYLVLGVVGGQGFLIGRGNQQLSPPVLRLVGRERVTILAHAHKLATLPRPALLVDSGDAALDRMFAGHIRVRTGPRRAMMMRIEAA